MWESYSALGAVLLTGIGLYFTIRSGIRSDHRQKALDAQEKLAEALKAATDPLKTRITELTEDHEHDIAEYQQRITELQESQERVIDNATVYFRDRLAELERDRNYWRELNNPRPRPRPPT